MRRVMAAVAISAALGMILAVSSGAGANESTDLADKSAHPEPGSWERPIVVQFRDLFTPSGKPSLDTLNWRGKVVEVVGFQTPPPEPDSPFLVLVGAPSNTCPYCESVDETEHPPYALVYPKDEWRHVSPRTRIRVAGELATSHNYDDSYGIHNDVRLLRAVVIRDPLALRPGREPDEYNTTGFEAVTTGEAFDD